MTAPKPHCEFCNTPALPSRDTWEPGDTLDAGDETEPWLFLDTAYDDEARKWVGCPHCGAGVTMVVQTARFQDVSGHWSDGSYQYAKCVRCPWGEP